MYGFSKKIEAWKHRNVDQGKIEKREKPQIEPLTYFRGWRSELRKEKSFEIW